MSKAPDPSKSHRLRDRFEYETAIREVEDLLEGNPKRGTPECDRLEFLSMLVEVYEKNAFPIDEPTPQAVADLLMGESDQVHSRDQSG